MSKSSSESKPSNSQFITWRQHLGLAECPYMIRWIFNFHFFSIRIHHWLKSDDKRYHHDHPWWFWTFVLWGSYIDDSPNGSDVVSRWTTRFRPALHRHTVILGKNMTCWTIVLTGRYTRPWGFWITATKFIKANRYFYQYGHHPCTDGDAPVKTDDRIYTDPPIDTASMIGLVRGNK